MTGNSFAAVDLGAASGRVVIGTFGPEGFTFDEVHRFVNNPITIDGVFDGVLCWNVEYLFEETLRGLSLALNRAHERGSTLTGIAVDSWGVDYGLVDNTNVLLAPVRHYRGADESMPARAADTVSASEAYGITGISALAINTCFQLMRDTQLGLLGEGVTALLTPDLWTAWLTGVQGAERTIASTTGLLNWETHDWAWDLMRRWGIPSSVMPNIVETGSLAGYTLDHLTLEIGATAPIAVYRAPAHDTASAFAAVTDVTSQAAIISCGTWALVGCVNDEPVLTAEAENMGFTNETAADGSALLVRNLSGTWLLEECLRAWTQESGELNSHHEDLRKELCEASEAESQQIVGTIDCGDPELIGVGDMPSRILALYHRTHGQSDSIQLTRPQIVRLILVSLADSFAETVSQTQQITGREFNQVIMIGGGSRIEQLVKLAEQAIGMPITVSHQEATSIGNICTQAVSSGLFDNMKQAREATHTLQNRK
jgi:rhamnulokinase